MKPHSIGRTLGIGLRVAGRIVGQRASAAAPTRASGRVAGQATRRAARGLAGLLRPFARVGGILWLEVTGALFLLPALAFLPALWRAKASWLHGPDHRTFVLCAAITLVFLYLSVSSFWRARRK